MQLTQYLAEMADPTFSKKQTNKFNAQLPKKQKADVLKRLAT